MKSREYSDLIWISKRICDAQLTKFIWVDSHEFQHFRQGTISYELSVANEFLLEALRCKNIKCDKLKVATTIPYEFDSEPSAFKAIIELFDKTTAEEYVNQPERIDRLGFLLSYDLNEQYDIIGKTIHILEKYHGQLDIYIQGSKDPVVKSFNIDGYIKRLRELEPHNIGVQVTA